MSDCYLPRLGGIERQVHDLAFRQFEHGHEAVVVSSTTTAETLSSGVVAVRRAPSQSSGKSGSIRYGWSWQGRRIVLAEKCDVVHIHTSAFSPLAFTTASATADAGIPTVVTVHSLMAYTSPLFRAADVVSGWRRWPVIWSAVSSVAAEPLRRLLGSARPVAVVPNGVDAAFWRSAPSPRSPDRIRIATVGRLVLRKRPGPLLEMVQKVRALLPREIELELVIVGEGPRRGSLERYIVRHGMGSWVQLGGVAEPAEIRSVFAGADFYVAPATLESFGIAALEARSAGLPVVGFADSGISDFIQHGVDGLLAGDDDEMVAQILSLSTSPGMLERMRRHNRHNAPAITWAGVLEQCASLYTEAIGEARTTTDQLGAIGRRS